jgi:hypothetical protein
MIRGSTISQEISLEEKRLYVPTPMIQELFFSMPTNVTPIVQDNMVARPVVGSPVTMVATPVVSSLMT